MGKYVKALVLLPLLVIAGCAANGGEPENEGYSESRVGEVERMESGEIISLEPVSIEGNESKVGTVVGAVAGGLAGRQVGGGTGKDIMTVIGAVAGGYAGREVSEGQARSDGVKLGIEMDDGDMISLIQELDENEQFRVGEEVTVVYSGDKAHVRH